MTGGVEFSLGRWSAWAPELDNRAAWRDWALAARDIPFSSEALPDVKDLPAGLRRRLSRLGKIALRVAMDVPMENPPPVVFSSRNGNVTQMLGLLKSLAVEEPVSPTGFGMSVHNSLVGMLSIVTGNRESHTAIAAGKDSFCLGLLEAALLVGESNGGPVMLLHCDETLPEFYAPFQDRNVPFAAFALELLPAGEGEGRYSVGFTGAETGESFGDPLAGFLRFLMLDEKKWAFDGAEGRWWCEKDE